MVDVGMGLWLFIELRMINTAGYRYKSDTSRVKTILRMYKYDDKWTIDFQSQTICKLLKYL